MLTGLFVHHVVRAILRRFVQSHPNVAATRKSDSHSVITPAHLLTRGLRWRLISFAQFSACEPATKARVTKMNGNGARSDGRLGPARGTQPAQKRPRSQQPMFATTPARLRRSPAGSRLARQLRILSPISWGMRSQASALTSADARPGSWCGCLPVVEVAAVFPGPSCRGPRYTGGRGGQDAGGPDSVILGTRR